MEDEDHLGPAHGVLFRTLSILSTWLDSRSVNCDCDLGGGRHARLAPVKINAGGIRKCAYNTTYYVCTSTPYHKSTYLPRPIHNRAERTGTPIHIRCAASGRLRACYA